MLGLFRRNLFLNLVFLVLFTAVLHGYYLFSEASQPFSWSFDILDRFLGFISSNHVLRVIITIILIALQAILINDSVIRHKLSRGLSTIPGAIFIIVCAIILESEVFHPALLANLFCILSLRSLFKIYKRHLPIATIYNSGFYMMVAALIYPPYAVFAIVLFFGLLSLRNIDIREVLQLLSGLLTPLFLFGVYLNLHGKADLLLFHFTGNMSLPWRTQDGTELALDATTLAKPLLVLLIIIVALLLQQSIKKKKKFDAIKKLELSYWMLFFSIISLFFIADISESHFIVTTAPLAIVLGLIMETKSNKIIKEFVFLLMILCFFGFLFKDGFSI